MEILVLQHVLPLIICSGLFFFDFIKDDYNNFSVKQTCNKGGHGMNLLPDPHHNAKIG